MRTALIGREDNLGFLPLQIQSRRVPPITVIDMDFADDIKRKYNQRSVYA